MWAYRLTGPRRLELTETAEPDPAFLPAHHVILRTLAGGICGSDIPKFDSARLPVNNSVSPLGFPLHEIVGEVVVSRSDALPAGSRVVGWAGESGGLAEYLITDGQRLTHYNPDLEPLQAVLIQSIACVLHALDRVDVAGQRIAVIGLGPIGLLFAHIAHHRGARTVIGVDPVDRSTEAPSIGIDELIVATSAKWLDQLRSAKRPTVCIEAVGHQTPTLNHALHATADAGTVLYFGIPDTRTYPIDMERLMRGHLTLVGGVTRDHRSALVSADRYLRQHPELYDVLVTHVFDRGQAQAAFDTASQAGPYRIKVLLELG